MNDHSFSPLHVPLVATCLLSPHVMEACCVEFHNRVVYAMVTRLPDVALENINLREMLP